MIRNKKRRLLNIQVLNFAYMIELINRKLRDITFDIFCFLTNFLQILYFMENHVICQNHETELKHLS